MSENAWIEHDGSVRPLGPYEEVEVEFGSGDRAKGCACDFEWEHHGSDPELFEDQDITHYRILGQAA